MSAGQGGMSDHNELLEGARIGIDAEAFRRSDFGKWLLDKARAEIEAATGQLIDARADDVAANTEYRNQIHVARMFLTWLDEAIHVGRHCHAELRDLEDLTPR